MSQFDREKVAAKLSLDVLPCPTMLLDAPMNIVSVNKALVKLLGKDKKQLLGQPLQALMNKANWLAVENMLATALDDGAPVEQFSIRLKNAEGGLVPVLVSANRTVQGTCLVLTPYDTRLNHERGVIAKRSEALDELARNKEHKNTLLRKQAEQAELIRKLEEVSAEFVQTEKMAAIGQLAAGVAHEINNPIGYVYSNLQTLAGYLDDLRQIIEAIDVVDDIAELKKLKQTLDYEFLRTDVGELLQESAQGIERVKQIITALKDFSRKDDVELQSVDLHQALETTLSVAWNEIKYKAEVHKEFGEIPPVVCHLGQINQVFMNLLVNAAQAIEGFGTISIATGVTGNQVWVRIKDSGKGIDDAVMPRIFEPFFTTKPVGEGTGLGLALTYNIMRKHGGEINVSTSAGEGTTFSVWLPIAGPGART